MCDIIWAIKTQKKQEKKHEKNALKNSNAYRPVALVDGQTKCVVKKQNPYKFCSSFKFIFFLIFFFFFWELKVDKEGEMPQK